MSNSDTAPKLAIRLPDGQVARVPLDALRAYVDADAKLAHAQDDRPTQETPHDDVVPHGMSIDRVTGASVWHTDWEIGWCTYTDESGFPQTAYAWHRHPLGNEYTELY